MFAYYDLFFLLIIFLSVLHALFKGGIATVFSTLSWLLALYLIHVYGKYFYEFVYQYINNLFIVHLVVFIFIFLVVVILLVFLNRIIIYLLKQLNLNELNIIIAIIFGVLRGILFVTILSKVLEYIMPQQAVIIHSTRLYILIEPMIRLLHYLLLLGMHYLSN